MVVVYVLFWIVLVAIILPMGDAAGDLPETRCLWIGLLTFFVIVFATLNGLGSAVGVYIVGTRGKQTGPFALTLVSGYVGGLVVAAFVTFFGSRVPSRAFQ